MKTPRRRLRPIDHRQRWHRRLVRLLLLLLATALLGTYAYLANPKRAAALAAGLVESMLDVRVEIGGARFGLDGTIKLDNLQLFVNGMPEAGSKLLDAEQVTIEHDTWSLVWGRFRPSRMVVHRPDLYLTQDPVAERFNYQFLVNNEEDEELPETLPTIYVDRGSILSGEVLDDRYKPLSRIELDGGLVGIPSKPGEYQFNLHQRLSTGEQGSMLGGRVDLHERRLIARLDPFNIDSPLSDLLPRRLREQWDQLKPTGLLSTVTFEADPASGIRARMELKDAAVSLPITEPSTRLKRVTGHIDIANDIIRPDLRCQVDHRRPNVQADCRITGWIQALNMASSDQPFDLSDAPFQISIKTGGYVPSQHNTRLEWAEWQAIPPVSKAMHWLYDWFSPEGHFNADVQAMRESRGHSAPIVKGMVRLNGSGKFLLFPYLLQDVDADLVLHEDGIDILRFNGRGSQDARVHISGRIAPLGLYPSVQIRVVGHDVPTDDRLFDAIRFRRPKVIPVIKMFMDERAYSDVGQRMQTRLTDLQAHREALDAESLPDTGQVMQVDQLIAKQQGLIRRLEGFAPGGNVSQMIAEISRPEGKAQQVEIETTLDMTGASIMFRYWPYPIKATMGKLIISPDRVVAAGIEGFGLDSQATFRLDGVVHRSEQGWSNAIPDMKITATNVPLNDLLWASVPERQGQLLVGLGLSGRGSADAQVIRGASGKIEFNVTARIDEGRAQPGGGRLRLDLADPPLEEDLAPAWQIRIEHNLVELEDLEGEVRDVSDPEAGDLGTLRLSGTATWKDEQPVVRLSVSGSDLRFDSPVLDLVPPDSAVAPKVRAFFERFRPQGSFDVDLQYEESAGQDPQYTLALQPKDVAFQLRGHTIELRDVDGRVKIANDRVRVDSFAGLFDGGHFTLAGDIGLDPLDVSLTFGVLADQLSEVVRTVLPRPVINTMELLSLTGPMEVEAGRLRYRPEATAGMRTRFGGSVILKGAEASIGIPLTDIHGRIDVYIHQLVGQSQPVFALELDAEHLRANDRFISPLTARVNTNPESPDQLLIRDLTGGCYGGSLAGRGSVDLVQAGSYEARMTLQGADFVSVLNPGQARSERGPDQDLSRSIPVRSQGESEGMLDASLDVQGKLAAPDNRMGRGSVRIRNATMYRLPMALGLLQIVNLTLPTSQAFDHADIEYGIEGDTIRFDRLQFRAASLVVDGTGLMNHETHELDLTLFARSPASVWDNPVSELLNKVKDELMTIRVIGTLEQPETSIESFSGVKRSWNSVFGSADTVD